MTKPDFLHIDEVAPRIAKVILGMLQDYPTSPARLQRHYRETLKWTARDLENFVLPCASVRAQEMAKSMGIPDIRQFRWGDQATKMKDPTRTIFHWEHVYPVKNIVQGLLRLEAPSSNDIATVLRKAKIAWILKSENSRLEHHKRDDPDQDYAQAGILLEC